jgi:omega-6 fatty acid desaturase (delta-12 desaturase)
MAFIIERTFIIFHDCGHNSYMPNRLLNYTIGNIMGVFVLTPFCWNWHHQNHHKTAGKLNNELQHKFNETTNYTLQQYMKWSIYTRILYRIFRNPAIFFTIVPLIYFIIKQRTDVFRYKLYRKDRFVESSVQIALETILSNTLISCFLYLLWQNELLKHYCAVICIVSSMIVVTFHNQHTYNPSYVINDGNWTQRNSGILGSSFILYPNWFKWFSMGIEYHHIHHMNAKIPGYNLRAYHEEVVSKSNLFDNIVKLSLSQCYNNLWLVLYDEHNGRYITFIEADKAMCKSS